MDRVADLGALEVDRDEVRDRIGGNRELDLVTHDVEHATALDAGRLLFVDEVDRHIDGHERVLADAQEVDMDRKIADRIELIVLRQNLDLLAGDVDRGDRGHEPAAVDLVVQLLVREGDRQGRLLVAIDDCWHFTVAASFAGGPLTDLLARIGLELVRIVAHGCSFRVVWSAPAPASRLLAETSKAALWAALIRVASKGVYAGGGSIADGSRWRNPAELARNPARRPYSTVAPGY